MKICTEKVSERMSDRKIGTMSFNEIVDVIKYNYSKGNFNYAVTVYTIAVHIGAIIGIFTVPYCHPYTLLFAFLLWISSGLGITAGAHRLWSHRSYKASFPLRVFLMICNTIANQGSIYHWARDHRVHHKHSETNADPHNAKSGFFFSHIGWVLVKKHPDVVEAGRKLQLDDLEEDPVVMLQKRLDPWLPLFFCFIFPGLICTLWGDSFVHGYWVAGTLRYVILLQSTFLVNSAAHFFGDHPYDPLSWPAENPFVSFLAHGEGWHNWHHKYPFDYAASEYGIERQYNPTKLFIDVCCLLGLASDPKRASGAWSRRRLRREEDIKHE